jgi:integrase
VASIREVTKAKGNSRWEVAFTDRNRNRRTISLPKVNQRVASQWKFHVEHLVAASHTGDAPPSETAMWLSNLSARHRTKLEKVGLAQPSEPRQQRTLGRLLDGYLEMRRDVKPATLEVWGHTVRNLKGHFGANKSLRTITCGDATDWLAYLHRQNLADATIRKRCGFAKQFLKYALDKEWIDRNPFADLASSSRVNMSKDYFVSAETSRAVLVACPDLQWKLIFALARWGGLRNPSETLQLTWDDIDWRRQLITVRSPKTERYGQGLRTIPMFPELQPLLGATRADGEGYVITRHRSNRDNMRTQWKRIVERAGITPWPKLFQNLRQTRATELADSYPAHVCDAWMGHSKQIADKHYRRVTEEHIAQALEKPPQKTPQQIPAPHGNNPKEGFDLVEKPPILIENSSYWVSSNPLSAEGTGLEPATP